MYLKQLKRNIKASDATIQKMIDSAPIGEFEALENAAIEIRVIDPPVINGITLTEHPNAYQREKYRKILNGGVVCGLFVNGEMKLLLPTPHGSSIIGKKAEDFVKDKEALVTHKVSEKILKHIEADVERIDPLNERKLRPRVLKPDDFWAQFTDNENIAIKASTDSGVVAFVEDINSKPIVPLKAQPTKDGTTLLFVNNLISQRTYSELMEA